MNYTPRQAFAFAEEAMRRRREGALETYSLARAAHHADAKGDKALRKGLSVE